MRSCRSSTRSTSPPPSPRRSAQEIEDIIGLDASRGGARLAPSPASASTRCSQAIVDKIPPPKGDRDAPLKAMLVDSWYDPYLGVVILVRVIDGVITQGPADQVHGRRHRRTWSTASAAFRPKIEQLQRARPRARSASSPRRSRKSRETRVGDTITDAKRPAARGAARLQGSPAGRLLRPVPGRRRRLREAPRQPLQAAPQRRLVQLRDGEQRGARLRLPLRLPRPAPPRDHPGAADPRI